MTSKQPIVHGGGWFTRQTFGKPKARFLAFLSLVWFPVAPVAGLVAWLGAIGPSPYVQWGCAVLVALEPIFITFAIIFRLVERPRKFTHCLRNPDYDTHSLH
jgi:hypothetical protein